MPPSQGLPPQLKNSSISPRSSAAPLLQQQDASQQYPEDVEDGEETQDIDPKTGKRRLFGLGKKKETQDSQNMDAAVGGNMLPSTQSAINAMKPDLKAHPAPLPLSPSSRNPYPSVAAAASPSRLRSSSPRLHSPASSEIFERNVQEPVPLSTLQSELTPAHIPSHVLTEDHIPAALEATAEAITSEDLNADDVEIVTSSAHQPAAEKVLEGSASHADLTSLQSPSIRHTASDASEVGLSSNQLPVAPEEEGASTYGQLDPNDVRRLSFISFADVVQSEHQQQAATSSSFGDIGSRDSLHISNFVPGTLPNVQERAGSPLRSPRSPGSLSGGVTTPPPGLNVHPTEEQSPVRSVATNTSTVQHGDLNIETMRQAVRKTASGDLSGVRNAQMSPISDEGSLRETMSRTNT